MWLNTTLIHARQRFLEKNTQRLILIPLDEALAESLADPNDCFISVESNQEAFDFEEARVYSDCSCAVIHEPIEDLQKQVLKVVNMMASVLVERVAEIKADNAQEMPSVEKKIVEAQTHLQRLQAGKLDLYEDYRQGKITRDKFISIQKGRQQEADRLHSSLTLLEGKLEMLRKKVDRMDRLVSDAKDIQMLPDYRPDVIRRLVQCIRVYGAGRIEVDLLENDDYLVEIFESVKSMAV